MLALHAISSLPRRLTRAEALCLILCLKIITITTAHAAPDLNQTHLPTNLTAISELIIGHELQEVVALTPGETVRRKMVGGEAHRFRLPLTPGQFARVLVEQQGIDVEIEIKAPDGRPLIKLDSPNGLQGPESISVVAQVAGDYIVEVRSDKRMPDGSYELRIEGPRPPSETDLRRVDAEHVFAEAQRLRFQGTPESRKQAIEKYKESLALWQVVGDTQRQAYTLCNIGRTYKMLGNITQALAYMNQSLSLLQQAQDVHGQAWVLNEIGAAYRTLDDPHQALEHYARALELRQRAADQWGQAQILNNMGLTHSYIGSQQRAIEHYQRATPLWQAVRDRYNEANTLNNLSLAYTDLGDLSFALESLQQVRSFSQDVGDTYLEAYVLNNIGRIYDTWAEAETALDYYQKALTLFRDLKNAEGEAMVLDNTGMAHSNLDDAPRALEFFNQALALRRRSDKPEPRGLGMTLTHIGYAYTLQGEHREALKYFEQALPLSREARNNLFIAYALMSKGIAHASLGETREALEFYAQALKLQNEMKDRRGQALTLNRIGQVHAAKNEAARALDNYEQALQLWAAIGDKQGQALTLYDIARLERDGNNLSEARKRIEAAVEIVESLRTNMTSQQLRVNYFAAKQNFYALNVDIRMLLYEQNGLEDDRTAALYTSERARARSLLELLAEARAEIHKDIPPQLAERAKALQQEINTLANNLVRLNNLNRTADAAAAEKRLDALINEHDDLQTKIRAGNKSYAALKRPQPLKLQQIQPLLDEETLLLEYALGEKRSYLWAVSRNTVNSYTLPGQAEVEAEATRLREFLTAPEPPRRGETNVQYLERLTTATKKYQAQASKMSRMLLAPVASQLHAKRLVIVADGALLYIPFEALPSPLQAPPREAAARSRNLVRAAEPAPLALSHVIVYEPSATTLSLLRDAPQKSALRTVAVFADPVFDGEDERVAGISQNATPKPAASTRSNELSRALRDVGDIGSATGPFKLERLRHSAKEADAIIAAAPGASAMKAIGFKANLATAMSPELSRYSIVHFATHGILDDKRPELSGVVLSLVNEQGRPEDGFLRLRDIYNLHLPADMVVLSACRTGLGKKVKGEGLIGLTRGFMYAGAKRVVASLWKVDDEATAELMKRFYQHMFKDRMPAASALNRARIEIMQARGQWRAPYYWAGFILQGDW